MEKLTDIFSINTPDIMLTEKCNLNCKYCFEKDKNGKNIDREKLLDYIKEQTNFSFFPFGGEPMLALDLLIKIKQEIESMDFAGKKKEEMIRGLTAIITNGTLIPQNLEKIKEHGFNCQISMDGPKDIHDKNRVFGNGAGSFDKVMKGLELLAQNNLPFSLHGVINKQSIKYFFAINKFFFELLMKERGIEETIHFFKHNSYQIIFEEEYTQQDIKDLTDGMEKFCDWIFEKQDLEIDKKRQFLKEFLAKKGSICGAGTALLALNVDFDIFPCHRSATISERANFKLGNVYEPENFKNYRLYNAYYHHAHEVRTSYSAVYDYSPNDPNAKSWFMWCPSTNLETSGNIYYQNAKYNLLFAEFHRLISYLIKKYGLNTEVNEPRSNGNGDETCHN